MGSSSIAAIAGRRRCSSSALRQGDRVAYIAPNTHAQLESFYAVPQIGAVLVPINYRLTAEDFAYIIGHSGARVVCAHSGLSRGGRWHPRPAAERRAFRRAGGSRKAGWLDYEATLAAAPPDFAQPEIRENDVLCDQLHQRHDLAAQRRDDHAPQRLD